MLFGVNIVQLCTSLCYFTSIGATLTFTGGLDSDTLHRHIPRLV